MNDLRISSPPLQSERPSNVTCPTCGHRGPLDPNNRCAECETLIEGDSIQSERERIARIIDPHGWDRYDRDINRPGGATWSVGLDVTKSLAKADAILANPEGDQK